MLTLCVPKNEQFLRSLNLIPASSGKVRLLGAAPANEEDPFNLLDVCKISAFVTGIINLNVVVYGNTPEWYNNDFLKKLAGCKLNAQDWVNNISLSIKAIPESIVNYDELYKFHLDSIKELCTILQKKPSPELKNSLISEINALITGVSAKVTLIEQLEGNLDKFIANLSTTYNLLETTKANAEKSVQANKQQIEDFQKRAKELEQEIENCRKAVMGTGIAAGVVVTVSPVCFALGPFALIAGIFCAAATLSLIIAAITMSVKCQQKQSELQALSLKMNNATLTLNSLVTLCNQIKSALSLVKEAKEQTSILKMLWKDLGDDMRSLINVLKNGEQNACQQAYAALLEELNGAATEQWSSIVDIAKKYSGIKIEYVKDPVKIDPAA